jgi:hypothetical protein
MKSRNAGIPECRRKGQSGIVSFSVILHHQSGIGIPASMSVRYRWSRTIPVVPSYGKNLGNQSGHTRLLGRCMSTHNCGTGEKDLPLYTVGFGTAVPLALHNIWTEEPQFKGIVPWEFDGLFMILSCSLDVGQDPLHIFLSFMFSY